MPKSGTIAETEISVYNCVHFTNSLVPTCIIFCHCARFCVFIQYCVHLHCRMAKTCFIHFVISFKEHQLRLIDFKIKNYLAMALVPCVDLLRL